MNSPLADTTLKPKNWLPSLKVPQVGRVWMTSYGMQDVLVLNTSKADVSAKRRELLLICVVMVLFLLSARVWVTPYGMQDAVGFVGSGFGKQLPENLGSIVPQRHESALQLELWSKYPGARDPDVTEALVRADLVRAAAHMAALAAIGQDSPSATEGAPAGGTPGNAGLAGSAESPVLTDEYGCPTHKRLFLGIMSTASESSNLRRHVLRGIYGQTRPVSTMDIRFIIGQPKDSGESTALLVEQSIYGDLVILDIRENMDEGKTFKYFQTMSELMRNGSMRTYDFVAKADEDTFIHLPNLSSYLHKVLRKYGKGGVGAEMGDIDGVDADSSFNLNKYDAHDIYLGRSTPPNFEGFPFMGGMLYMLSRDLVDAVVTSPNISEEDRIGGEDYRTNQWVTKTGRDVVRVSSARDWVDHPWAKSERAPPELENTTIGVHQCKDIPRLWNCVERFFGNWVFQNGEPSHDGNFRQMNMMRLPRMDETPDCTIAPKA